MEQIQNHSESLDADRAQFRFLTERLSSLIMANGIESRAYDSSELKWFSKLSDESRKNAISEVSKYLDLCESIVTEGGNLNSSRTFIWRAIKDSGLIPPADLFSKISDTDVVEIYDLNNVQRFRNFKFFEFCSYTLEDLYSRPWNDLFVRIDASITSGLLELLNRLISGHDRRVVKTGFGRQIIEETSSRRCHMMEADVKYLALLFDRTDHPAAFIGVEDARLLVRA